MDLRLFNSGGNRPAPIPHVPLPPFDPNDSGGQVHTVLPPEQTIPPHFTDPTWLRGDFNGVTLPGFATPNGQRDVTITTGRWQGLVIPWRQGANSTPNTMIMTPMLPLYPRDVQIAVLTEHAERGYDDLVVVSEGWNFPDNGYNPSPDDVAAWAEYAHSVWGFRIVYWRGYWQNEVDAYFRAMQPLTSLYIHGKEVDQQAPSEQYEASLQRMDAYIKGSIPIGVHFSADNDRQMGYPIGFPRDTFLNDWSPYDGRVHLCQQLCGGINLDQPNWQLTLAGTQGASMWYARLQVNAGIGDAARGPGAPNSRVIMFENMASAQLYGRCDEGYGNLRDWEILCGTRTNPVCRPVSGFTNGCRYPSGDPI